MSKIQNWEDQIKQFKQLSLNNAKDLYREYMKDLDPEKRNLLIESTLYVVTKYAKELAKAMNNPNVDDIIILSSEYYIREVNKGRLLNIKNFSEIFDENYKSFIASNMVVKNDMPLTENFYYEDIETPIIEKVDEENKVKSMNEKGYSSVVIMSIITGIASLGIIVLGTFLTK